MRSRLARLVFLTALLHLYIGWRLVPDLPWPPAVIVLCVAWLVISTLPVSRSFTGWLAPRWPRTSGRPGIEG